MHSKVLVAKTIVHVPCVHSRACMKCYSFMEYEGSILPPKINSVCVWGGGGGGPRGPTS